MNMRATFLLSLAAFSLCILPVNQAAALDCNNAQTQMEMNECAGRDWQEADDALNAAYKSVRRQLKGTETGDALLKAQRLWIKFRDAHCDTAGLQYEGGSIQPLIIRSCMTEMTRTRTKQILQLVQP